MQNIEQILESGLNEDLIRGIFSNPRDKEYLRIKMRPILKEGRLHFQFESYTEKQVFHENLEKEEAKEKKSNNSLDRKTSGTPMYLKAWRKKHPNAYRDGRIYVFNEY